jgi:hypothetical protein
MKRVLILTITMLFVLAAFAQKKTAYSDSYIGQVLHGYVVYMNNDTVKCTFKMKMLSEMQDAAPVDNTDKDTKYRGFSAEFFKCFVLDNGMTWYSTKFYNINAKGNWGDKPQFMNISNDGPLFCYSHYSYDSANKKDSQSSFMQLPNGEVVNTATMLMGFKNKMSGYVKDYTELATKISNKEKGYGAFNFDKIVEEYNQWFLSKNPGFTNLKAN